MNEGMFEIAARSAGDRAGVFEHDGETGYFYLCAAIEQNVQSIIAAVHVLTGSPGFGANEIAVRWSDSERLVGFFVRDEIWAAFDGATGASYGGAYRPNGRTRVLEEIRAAIEM